MTRLHNDPSVFADEMIEGFVAANRRWVRQVNGGVVRRKPAAEGTVAVVIGGGSGHYPAFGGLVGPGLAAGAAMGNVFASPSAQQVYAVAKSAQSGGGVLFGYGNYAGDVLNFDQAQRRLNAEAIECRTVVVTDDISSASTAERQKRRGVAGDLVVFKVAAAAAEQGYSLAEVERVATKGNARTRSLGVAFTGCTLPGATEPLFTIPDGRMAMGMGIHGEPGIRETDVPTADGLAAIFVEGLLAELPDGVEQVAGSRVVPVLNGLGSVKYEELFVVYRAIDRALRDAGAVVIDPQVGEFCTSFDMAGASLTLFWPDEELEALWLADADSPAFRRSGTVAFDEVDDAVQAADTVQIPPANDASRAAAAVIVGALAVVVEVIDDHFDELGQMDAVAGDGDHGIGMQRGSHAALEDAQRIEALGAGAGTVLVAAGDGWAARAGGTSGALWGLILRTVGEDLGDENTPTVTGIAAAIRKASDAVMRTGGAEPGDKTMVDSLVPFAEAIDESAEAGRPLGESWAAAAGTAAIAAADTAKLLPRMGRARPHAERSVGTPDPGAHSLALIVTAVGEYLTERNTGRG